MKPKKQYRVLKSEIRQKAFEAEVERLMKNSPGLPRLIAQRTAFKNLELKRSRKRFVRL